jgi:hypothetical protein
MRALRWGDAGGRPGFTMAEVGTTMSRIGHGVLFLVGIFLLSAADPALAQDNYEAGKKPAQMFATDCGLCHKSAVGLGSKTPGVFGLESFLREHYTASREAAAAIAGYLRSVNAAEPPRAATKRRKAEPQPKSSDRLAKPEEGRRAKRPGAKRIGAEPKPDTKARSEKPTEPKAAEPKPAEPKAEPTPAESKPVESKPAEAPATPAAPAAKPE